MSALFLGRDTHGKLSLARDKHGKQVFLIGGLVDAQDWARSMVESGDAISVDCDDEIAITARPTDGQRQRAN
jgi:hypothetical protein